MEDYPRRSVVGGVAASIALAAGCLSSPETQRDLEDESDSGPESDPDDDSTSEDTGDTDSDDLEGADDGEIIGESLFEFVPASIEADKMAVTAAVPAPLQEVESGNRLLPNAEVLGIDPASVDRQVVVNAGSELSERVVVFSGEFEPEGEPVQTEDDGVEYDRYETEIGVAADYDDHLVVADSRERLTAAIDARRGETDRLLERNAAVESSLSAVDAGHLTSVYFGFGESFAGEIDADAGNMRYVLQSITVPDPETFEVTWALEFVDATYATDGVAAGFAELMTEHRGPFLEGPTTTVDGSFVAVSFVEDLEAKREMAEHESPGSLHVRDVDPEAEYVEIELGTGEPTPVDELTLELDGEVYDSEIWAGDAETIEAGDVLRVRTDDVEPNTKVTLRHEMNGIESASSTSILHHLEFEYDRDHESGTVTITYRDEFRLSGDEITIGVFDMRAPRRGGEREPERTFKPWAGETVEAGDRVEIDDVEHGKWITVQRGGEAFGNAISHHRIRPPGTVSFEHDREAGRLAITLEFEHDESRPADEYEIRVEDEPADTQWDGGRIESGSTVRLEAPDVGERVTVVWGDNDLRIGSTKISPAVDVEFDLQDGLTLEHVGGRSLPVEDLNLHVMGDDVSSHTYLADITEGQFAEGDTLDVELEGDVEDVEALYLVYDGMLIAQYPDEA